MARGHCGVRSLRHRAGRWNLSGRGAASQRTGEGPRRRPGLRQRDRPLRRRRGNWERARPKARCLGTEPTATPSAIPRQTRLDECRELPDVGRLGGDGFRTIGRGLREVTGRSAENPCSRASHELDSLRAHVTFVAGSITGVRVLTEKSKPYPIRTSKSHLSRRGTITHMTVQLSFRTHHSLQEL